LEEIYSTCSGIKGEQRSSDIIETLPNGYEVFTSLHIQTKQGNRAEYDQIIVGDNGLFVIEVKNHNGNIVGNEEDSTWTQHKVGRKGGEYLKEMKSN